MNLVLLSQKGGVSKSTLAMAVAWEWHAQNRRVLLVDADVNAVCVTAAQVAERNGAPRPEVLRMPRALRAHLMKAGPRFQDVVVDTPAGMGALQLEALTLADVALVPVTPGLDVWALNETVEAVRRAQVGHSRGLRGALVVSQRVPGTELGDRLRGVLEETGMPVFRAEVGFRQTWAKSSLAGLGVAQYRPKSAAADELRALLLELEQFAKGGQRAKAS